MSQFSGSISRTRIVLPYKASNNIIPTSSFALIACSDLALLSLSFVIKSYLQLGISVFWSTIHILFWGAGASILYIGYNPRSLRQTGGQWLTIGMLAVLRFAQMAAYWTALGRLSTLRVVVLTHLFSQLFRFCTSGPPLSRVMAFVFGSAVTLFSDPSPIHYSAIGYLSIVFHSLATTGIDFTTGSSFSPAVSVDVHVLGSLGAAIIAAPIYLLKHSLFLSSNVQISPLIYAAFPCAAGVLTFLQPLTQHLTQSTTISRTFTLSSWLRFTIAFIAATLWQHQHLSWMDILLTFLFFFALRPSAQKLSDSTAPSPVIRLVRSYVKIIMSNSESSRIFYFLLLNLAFMLVQMLYGVWTNSLGLISDAIHMAFDCMAIAMGLIASIMANWPPNEQFTYGYGRIETLSGFANGIFLILISVFIVFEAIERLLDPPDMNTSKLLLVSSLGLGVNLFGMFAMGGHHHGPGHSHSHSHSHSHPHSHSHSHSHGHEASYQSPPDSDSDRPNTPLTPAYCFEHESNDTHSEHHGSSHHEGSSHNMRGVFLHVMADTLGSVGVIVSTLLIQYYGWTGFDPIASLFIAVMIVASVIPLVIDTGRVLALDNGSSDAGIQDALQAVTMVDGVIGHSMARFWPKDSETLVGSVHVQVSPQQLDGLMPVKSKIDSITESVNDLLTRKITGLQDLTIQVEIAQRSHDS